MKFVKSTHAASAAASIANLVLPSDLNIENNGSIQGVSRTIASGAMSYYPGNATAFADLPEPYYWWECGAMMGAMLDYSHYTQDHTYDETIATALLAQVGPDFDYMLPKHFGDEGNDDQAFWGFAVMAAAERNFPQPDPSVPSWLELAANLWNSLASRWDTSACGGGLPWQIFASNPNGLHYKNTVSNGGLFQLSARLARATGNDTYLQWAHKVWDWTTGVGMIDAAFNVYDGADARDNCTKINPVSFSYSAGIYLYGAAVLANHTAGADRGAWTARAEGLLKAVDSFFGPFPNATGIMYEHACEQVGRCNVDMLSFKGYLSRFMYASARVLPSLAPAVRARLEPSAKAAAKACSGGEHGTSCGQKWYVGGFDGNTGLGQELCALETVQGLLAGGAAPPLRGDQIKTVRTFASNSSPPPSSASVSRREPSATEGEPRSQRSDSGSVALGVDVRGVALVGLTVLLVWGMV